MVQVLYLKRSDCITLFFYLFLVILSFIFVDEYMVQFNARQRFIYLQVMVRHSSKIMHEVLVHCNLSAIQACL